MKNVYFQTNLWRNPLNSPYILLLNFNFENLIIRFHVLNVLNTHVKFHSNRMLFTIRLINIFFMYKFKLQKLEI